MYYPGFIWVYTLVLPRTTITCTLWPIFWPSTLLWMYHFKCVVSDCSLRSSLEVAQSAGFTLKSTGFTLHVSTLHFTWSEEWTPEVLNFEWLQVNTLKSAFKVVHVTLQSAGIKCSGVSSRNSSEATFGQYQNELIWQCSYARQIQGTRTCHCIFFVEDYIKVTKLWMDDIFGWIENLDGFGISYISGWNLYTSITRLNYRCLTNKKKGMLLKPWMEQLTMANYRRSMKCCHGCQLEQPMRLRVYRECTRSGCSNWTTHTRFNLNFMNTQKSILKKRINYILPWRLTNTYKYIGVQLLNYN
jgi:hypothetical protein